MTRPTVADKPKNDHFSGLNGIRAIAALSVLAFHVDGAGFVPAGDINRLLDHLNVGVSLFFLLSGFLLYRPFVVARTQARNVPVGGYLKRRLARIVPAYWVALFALAIWPGLPGFFSGAWVPSVAFAQIYSLHWYWSGLPVAWSLCTEVSFYLLLPIYAWAVASVTRRLSDRPAFYVDVCILALIALATAILKVLISRHPSLIGIGLSLPATAYLFCAGMLLALCSVHRERALSRALARVGAHRGFCWLLGLAFFVAISLVSLPLAGYRGSFLGPTHPLYLPVALLMLMPLTLAPAPQARLDSFLASRPMVALGMISYGIYLWHYPIVHEVGRVFGHAAFGIPVLLGTALVSCAIAGVSYALVEKPALALARRHWHVRPDSTASARAVIHPPDPMAALTSTAPPDL